MLVCWKCNNTLIYRNVYGPVCQTRGRHFWLARSISTPATVSLVLDIMLLSAVPVFGVPIWCFLLSWFKGVWQLVCAPLIVVCGMVSGYLWLWQA